MNWTPYKLVTNIWINVKCIINNTRYRAPDKVHICGNTHNFLLNKYWTSKFGVYISIKYFKYALDYKNTQNKISTIYWNMWFRIRKVRSKKHLIERVAEIAIKKSALVENYWKKSALTWKLLKNQHWFENSEVNILCVKIYLKLWSYMVSCPSQMSTISAICIHWPHKQPHK